MPTHMAWAATTVCSVAAGTARIRRANKGGSRFIVSSTALEPPGVDGAALCLLLPHALPTARWASAVGPAVTLVTLALARAEAALSVPCTHHLAPAWHTQVGPSCPPRGGPGRASAARSLALPSGPLCSGHLQQQQQPVVRAMLGAGAGEGEGKGEGEGEKEREREREWGKLVALHT